MQSIDERKLTEDIIRHGFWFVDIPRTGSTSLKRELEVVYGTAYAKKRITALHDHATASEVREVLGKDAWNRLFTFTVVRNPWARAYSLYQYRRKISQNIPDDMAFGTYVRALAAEKRLPKTQRTWYPGYLMSACDYLTDASGELLVDFVGKFEDRHTLFTTLNRHLSVPLLGDVHVMKTSGHERPWQDAYDAESRELVGELYADDVVRFGYAFTEKQERPYAPSLSPEELISHLTRRLERAEEDLNLTRHQLEDAKAVEWQTSSRTKDLLTAIEVLRQEATLQTQTLEDLRERIMKSRKNPWVKLGRHMPIAKLTHLNVDPT